MRKQDNKPKQRERIAENNFAIEYFDVVQNESKENRKTKKGQKRWTPKKNKKKKKNERDRDI